MRITNAVFVLLMLLSGISTANSDSGFEATDSPRPSIVTGTQVEQTSSSGTVQKSPSKSPQLFTAAHADEVASMDMSTVKQNPEGLPLMLIYVLGTLVLSIVTLSKERSSND